MGGTLRARLAPVLEPCEEHAPRPGGAGCDEREGGRLARLLADPARRIGVPDVTDRATWEAVPAAVRDAVLVAAADELVRPAPCLTASAWARAFRDGNRGAYEDRAWALQERVSLLALAAVLTGEVASATAAPGDCPHLDAAVDGLVAFAEASTWCWAPHERGVAARGELVPDPDDPFLDLGAAEVGALFAWADHALGPHLDLRMPGLRRRLRREADRRVLTPFERRRDWHWIGAEGRANNWNPWIHGAVLACALLLGDDDPRRARLVRLLVHDLDHYLLALPDDGGIDEGIAYWWVGACRVLEILDLLADVGGADLDARDLPLLREVVRYPQRMHLGGDHYVNVGDAPARPAGDQPWQVPYRWGVRLGQPETVAHAVAGARERGAAVAPRAGLGRALTALADRDWCRSFTADTPPAGAPWLARECWLPRLQLLVARESAGSASGLTMAVKGGHNGEHHNHLDVGSYWVAVDGRPLVVDVGRPTYTAGTFGPERYAAWPFRSAWHNVPEPGHGQLPGARYGARDVATRLGGRISAWQAELSGAYPPGPLVRWDRTVRLVRAEAGTPAHVLVVDRWQGAAESVVLRHVLAGEVAHGPGWATVTVPGGPGLRMSWDHRVAAASVDLRELNDPQLTRSWGAYLTRLTLTVREPGGPGRVAVRWQRSP
ncbi:heparinase II/III domain-containing protein [Streptomyces shenzhenensis]